MIPSLSAGGAERVVATHANYWSDLGWQVTILTCYPGQHGSFYRLGPNIRHINVDFESESTGVWDGVKKNIKRNFGIRRAIIHSMPDCIISHLISANVRTIIASAGLGIPVIVTEHSTPGYTCSERGWGVLRTVCYPFADAISTPNRFMLDYFSHTVKRRCIEIRNPVFVETDTNDTGISCLYGKRNVAAMGRLTHQKRFDLLLNAFAMIPTSLECHLTVVGSGPLLPVLERQALDLGIEERIHFVGNIKNPWSVLKNVDVFVLSSESENFPMVLLESMICGVATVSFDCPVGPGQIIQNEVDGLLVPPLNVAELSLAIRNLLENDSKRLDLGASAKKNAKKYSIEKVMPVWNKLIENLIMSKSGKQHG